MPRTVVASQGDVTPVIYHSPEEHIAALENALNQVRAEADAAVRKESGERAAALEAERQVREESDQEIVGRVRDEILNKHPQEAMGTGLIALGIILATAPKEIASLVSLIFKAQ